MQDHVATLVRSGSCLCRGVTFRVRGNPLRVGICHCADCRKSNGAPFSAYGVWPVEAFEQEGGFTGTYANRTFCTTCGGRVPWHRSTRRIRPSRLPKLEKTVTVPNLVSNTLEQWS